MFKTVKCPVRAILPGFGVHHVKCEVRAISTGFGKPQVIFSETEPSIACFLQQSITRNRKSKIENRKSEIGLTLHRKSNIQNHAISNEAIQYIRAGTARA